MHIKWGGVLDDGGDRPAAGQEALVRSAISEWRVGLIDITAANRLLNFGPGGAGVVEVTRPAAGDVLARLASGGSFAFRSLRPWAGPAAEVPPPAPYLLDTGMGPDDLDAALQALMRRSDQEYLERGGPALYLTFGTLAWTGRDRARYTSPLLLVPVALVAAEPRQPPMLEPAGDDPLVNPALRLELARHRIRLPRAGDLAQAPLSGLLDAVRAAVAGQDGWTVADGVALACFPPMKEAMYQDLLDHEDLVAAHPAVRALAAPGPAAPGPGAPGPGGGGQGRPRAAAGPAPVVLNADSAQHACVMAALAGRSFTIDGPPGTGKSQTIANMAGALLHAGKTVLVVSAKAAALDVVAARLGGAGLGGYLLELHSHKARRTEVAASLAEALDRAPAAAPPASAEAAAGQRERLGDYAHALNRVREPLGYSLHDVLEMIASLHAVPAAPVPRRAPAQLTPAVLGEIRRAAADLAAAWRPAAQGRSFAWRGVAERESLDERLYEAASALEALAKVVRGNQPLAQATGLTRPSDAPALARILEHLLMWPAGLPDEWLTADTLDLVDAAVAQLTAALTAIVARETQASRAAGAGWASLPQRAALPPVDLTALAALDPACADIGGLTAGQITGLAREFAAFAGLLEEWLGLLSRLAATLGLRAPVTFADASDLLTLARLAAEPDRPERAWLSAPGYRAASTAAQALYNAHAALAGAEAAARRYFTPDALRQDVDGLAARFANEHHGLGRLSGGYRADKQAIAAFTREGIPEEAALEHLGLAAAWRHAAQALADAEAGHAVLLGPHYAGRATDFTRLDRALTHAATAVRAARGQDLSRAAGHISRDAAPDGAVSGIVIQARQHLSAWQAILEPAPALAPRPELMNGTIVAATGWLRAHGGPLHAAGEFTEAAGAAVGSQLTYDQARQVVALREAAEAAHAELAAREAIFADLCGPLYAGAGTDLMALRDALEWARQLRTMITGGPGPLTPAHLDAAESAVPTDRIAKASDAWQEARAALLAAFSPQRRPGLAAELDDYQAGDHLLEAMFNDPGGRDEWHAYAAARAALAAHGMDGAIDFCAGGGVPAALVPRVIERALLQEWAEYQLRTDPALAPLQAAGPDALVDGFRRLDTALTAAAAQDIIRACDARRPRGDTGEAALVRKEAARTSGHLPVAGLLDRAGHLAQALKPCFLAPPLAVSQYLPAGLRFDAVIVDEAGLLSPGDAVTCIYRGSALILAGDDRQLAPPGPPGGTPAGAGPGSVFDLAKASGAFGHLTLSRHYRSRDEALIAFANAAFYDGRLVPVPGGGPGTGDRPEAAVELFHGAGTYREALRDNPAEAARVARRIVHHYDTRPALSLGVVTFSEAQAGAIEQALASAREQRPGLDRFFTTDRLHGFFVKPAGAVQGDERDVLIVSVGYGPDENGRPATDPGPLGGPGGWRLLNVAITRARCRTEIVTSIRAGDIAGPGAGDGLAVLRRYLGYAATTAVR